MLAIQTAQGKHALTEFIEKRDFCHRLGNTFRQLKPPLALQSDGAWLSANQRLGGLAVAVEQPDGGDNKLAGASMFVGGLGLVLGWSLRGLIAIGHSFRRTKRFDATLV